MTSDWDINEGLDPEGPSAHDLDKFGDELTTCPSCQRQIYDQAEICPHCGEYITPFPEASKQKSVWVSIGVLLLIVLLLSFVW